MSAQHLPSEILEQIILLLPPPDAYQCMFVSKIWYSFAVRTFYETLTLDDKKLVSLESLYLLRKKKESQDPYLLNHGHLVKELIIQDNEKPLAHSRHLLAALLHHLPSLKVLDIASSPHCRFYLMVLLDDVQKEDLENIQQIKVYSEEDMPLAEGNCKLTSDYFMACYRCKNTITHLELYDLKPMYNVNGQPGSYLHFLPHFKNLTHLSLTNNQLYRANNRNDSSVMPSVLGVCPNLISFELKNSFSIPDHDDDPELLFLLDEIEQGERIRPAVVIENSTASRSTVAITSAPTPSPMNNVNMHQSFPYNMHLRTLVLVLPTLDASQMEYITSYIPTYQLEYFELKLTREIFHEWIQSINIKTLLNFAQHLSLVENLDFNVSSLKNTYKRVQSGQLSEEEVLKRTRFWMFIDALKGGRDLECHMKFAVLPKPVTRPFNFGVMFQGDEIMCLGHVVGYQDFFVEDEEGALSSSFFIPLQASTLQTLEIALPEGDPVQLMKYIFKNCPQLLRFEIHASNSQHFIFKRQYDCIDCYLDEQQTSELPPFNAVQLNNAIISTILLFNVTTLVPQLEELKINNCIFLEASDPYFKCATLNLSGIQHLKHLVLNIPFVTNDYDQVFLRFKSFYSNGEAETESYKSEMINEQQVLLRVPGSTIETYHKVNYSQRLAIVVMCTKIDKVTIGTTEEENSHVDTIYPGSYKHQEIILY